MYQMGAAVLRAGFRVKTRINFFHKCVFAFGTHNKRVVFVDLSAEFLLGAGFSLSEQLLDFQFSGFSLQIRNYAIEQRPDLHGNHVLWATVR